jgi:branched-chain amino acid transport system permease protein
VAAAAAPADGLAARTHEFKPSTAGVAARIYVAVGLTALVLLLPLRTNDVWDSRIALAAIYGVIGLSINVLTGYAGQVSLGHQAFVGLGAFMSAFVAAKAGFMVGVPAAGVTGAVAALALGLVALRIRGLYLALVTLAFGRMAEQTIFNWRAFTGAGAGAAAPRPSVFSSDQSFAYLCMLVLAVVLLVDWRLARSKAGRALVALRGDERVASTIGVNVTAYKLLAFVVSGFLAGVAGSLYAHWNQFANAEDYNFTVALTWILMAVVGGLGSRAGVVIGSALFALFPYLLPGHAVNLPGLGSRSLALLTPLLGAFLLLLTITLYPGGIGQQLLPLRRWLSGGPLVLHGGGRRRSGEFMARPDEAETVDAGETEAQAFDPAPSDDEAPTKQIVLPWAAKRRKGPRLFAIRRGEDR